MASSIIFFIIAATLSASVGGTFHDQFVVHLEQQPRACFRERVVQPDHRELDHVRGAALHGRVDRRALGGLSA